MEEHVYEETVIVEEDYDYYVERPNDLRKLSDMEEWQIGEGEPDIRGWAVIDEDGNRIGGIDDLMVSEEMGAAIMAIVSFGEGNRTLVPIDWLELNPDNNQALFLGVREDLEEAPKFSEDEKDSGGYYDYWEERESDLVSEEEEDGMLVLDLSGWKLVDEAGHEIGEISDLVTDDRGALAVVSFGSYWNLDTRQTLIPLDLLEADEETQLVHLDVTADHVRDAPGYTEDKEDCGIYYDYWLGPQQPA